jgi:hypothetical protein
MKIHFDPDPETTVRLFLIIVAVLAVFSLAGQVSTYYFGDGHLQGFVPEFNLDREMNVPTWFSSMLFLFAAVLLWKAGEIPVSSGRTFRKRWRGLAVVFTAISIDDVAAIHEMAVDPFRKWLHAGGWLYFTWVVPAAALVALLTVFYWKLFMSLPRRTQRLFFLAALLFFGGSIGMEMVGGRYVEAHGAWNFQYALMANIEEILEFLGQIVFIKGLFSLFPKDDKGQCQGPE